MSSIRSLFALAAGMMLSLYAQAQSLEGCVMLNDSTPAAFATIYLPEQGIGTTTDAEGRYLLEGINLGTVPVEYSYLGYQTINRKLVIDTAKRYAHDERMEEQVIRLSEVFVTSNDEDPARYILNRVGERARVNRKRLLSYDATFSGTLHTQDLDIIPLLIPKMALWVLRKAIALSGFGALTDYCMEHERLDASYRLQVHYAKKKMSFDEWQLLSSSAPLDKKVQKSLRKTAEMDPFEIYYASIIEGKTQKSGFKLVGMVEENGKIIDVLERRDSLSVSSIYVVEEEWGVLRKTYNSDYGHLVFEARDIGQGIYLPISYINDPKPFDFNAFIQDAIEKNPEDFQPEKMSRMERNVAERIEKILKGERRFKPCLTESTHIKYSNVVLSPK